MDLDKKYDDSLSFYDNFILFFKVWHLFDLTSLQLCGWIIIIRVDYEYTVYTIRNKYLKLICHSEVFCRRVRIQWSKINSILLIIKQLCTYLISEYIHLTCKIRASHWLWVNFKNPIRKTFKLSKVFTKLKMLTNIHEIDKQRLLFLGLQ